MGQVKRDHYGRPLLPDPRMKGKKGAQNKVPWTRATTMAEVVNDRRALERWGQWNIVSGFAQDHDLVLRASAAHSIPEEEARKRELGAVADDAQRIAGRDAASARGTALHMLAESIDTGNPISVPEEYAADIKAYREVMDQARITVIPEFVERMLVNPDVGCAGTPDRIVHDPTTDRPVILDLKTGPGTMDHGLLRTAVQLTVYAWSSHWWDGQRWQDLPDLERNYAIVAFMPAGEGRCELYNFDLNIGKRGLLLAHQVHELRQEKGIATPRTDVIHSDTEARRRVARIKEHMTGLGLRDLPLPWPADLPTPSRLERPYDQLEASVVVMWCSFAEDALGIPPF